MDHSKIESKRERERERERTTDKCDRSHTSNVAAITFPIVVDDLISRVIIKSHENDDDHKHKTYENLMKQGHIITPSTISIDVVPPVYMIT